MIARSTPMRRAMTSTSGAMQLVVQLAHEMIRTSSFSARFTPGITVATVSVLAGAERIANLAPALMCLIRSRSSRNSPVHSRTRSTLSSDQGSAAGSFSANSGMDRPSIVSALSFASTCLWYRP
jgi:hypothetical protein